MSMMISLACSNIQTNQVDACTHAMEAATKQIQLYQYEEKTENYLMTYAQNTADHSLGKTAEDVGGGTVYGYKVYRNKSITFRLPNMGVCDTLSNNVTLDSYSINLTWKLPWL